MQFRALKIADAYEFTPRAFPDERGLFVAPFQEEALVEATGHGMRVGQTNHSVSRRGTIRGVHFADVPPSQAKYVYCPSGSLLDVVVDLRVGSPTFGQWDSALLDAKDFRAVYVAEGLGHAFVALEDNTVMAYLCSEPYNPPAEHGITPLDPALGLPWPADLTPVVSEKDTAAPTLAQAREQGLLPSYDDCTAYYEKLRDR
ncbi:MAG TPA: dTDP-4-dehydrorhamnose 3,5-epimerase [Amycolatopsis sp.]|jgi:epimerase EvaD|nr:dTDP-4-dehydrorhamnose 3,5-epimerase [Amycolatopsis sp.]